MCLLSLQLGEMTKAKCVFLAFATSQEDPSNSCLTVSIVGETTLPQPVQIWVSQSELKENVDVVRIFLFLSTIIFCHTIASRVQ